MKFFQFWLSKETFTQTLWFSSRTKFYMKVEKLQIEYVCTMLLFSGDWKISKVDKIDPQEIVDVL